MRKLKKMSRKELRKEIKFLKQAHKDVYALASARLDKWHEWKTKANELTEELEKQKNTFEQQKVSWKQQFDAEVFEKNRKGAAYIGQMPDNLNMGVDGQLEEEGHQPFDEPTNGVSDPNKLEEQYRDEKEIEAEEWAERNGHPNLKQSDRMGSVVVNAPAKPVEYIESGHTDKM